MPSCSIAEMLEAGEVTAESLVGKTVWYVAKGWRCVEVSGPHLVVEAAPFYDETYDVEAFLVNGMSPVNCFLSDAALTRIRELMENEKE